MAGEELVSTLPIEMVILAIIHIFTKGESEGYHKIEAKKLEYTQRPQPIMSRLTALVVAWVTGCCAVLMIFLAIVNREQWKILAVFSGTLLIITTLCAWAYNAGSKKDAAEKAGA